MYTTQEQENILVVQGFFEAFRSDNNVDQYVQDNFIEEARFIIHRGGEEIYDGINEEEPGEGIRIAFVDEPRPEAVLEDTNAYFSDERFSHERNALVPEMAEFIGAEGVLNFLSSLNADFDFNSSFTEFNDLKYIADGNDVAVFGYLRYVHERTGNFVSTPFAINIEMEEGKIARYHYVDNSFAYAAGSREGGTWQGQYGLQWTENEGPVPAIHPVSIQWGTRAGETLVGDQDPEQLRDQLYGYQGDDTLQGGEDDDTLWGGSGNDVLEGGAGVDILWGGIGFDTVTGGDDRDIFVLTSDFGVAAPGDEGFVTITDFEDSVDLFALDPGLLDSTTGGDVNILRPELFFSDLTFVQEGADTVISLTDTGELVARVSNFDPANLTAADFVTKEETEDTFLESFPAFRGFPEDTANPDVFTPENEARYLATAQGFFQAFANGTIFPYIAENFSEDSKYIIIESQNSYYERYNPEIDDYSVSFSHERFGITPPTQEWEGIEGAQAFIASLGDANDLTDPVTAFYIDEYIVHGNDIGIFGSFQYRDRFTGNIHDVPLAYHWQLDPETAKVDFIHFFEDAYSYSIAARNGGTWTANLSAEETVDFTFGKIEADEISGGDSTDQIYGYQGDDTINGGAADDVIFGGEGNDVIAGGLGTDLLYGGTELESFGNDLFILTPGEGSDTIADFTKGEDTLELTNGLTSAQLSFTQTGDDTVISVTETGEVLATLLGVQASTVEGSDFGETELIFGSPVPDNFDAAVNDGFDGELELLFAGAGEDFVDSSQALTGRNRIYTGGEVDEIIVGERDRAFGGDGSDIIDATIGDGNNRLYGGAGNDEIYVKLNDRAFGGEGEDILDATLSEGGNRLYGNEGDDSFFLGTGDRAVGGEGEDQFFTGTQGGNTITGGLDADQFWVVNAELPEALNSEAGLPDSANTITDFDLSLDVIGIGGFTEADLNFSSNTAGDALLQVSGNNVAIFLGITDTQLQTATFAFA